MGVPKFFRYISERYPCLSEFVSEQEIPVFDNLYLDMNGIIHMCSHPDDSNPHFRITDENIFRDIFHYIEVLFCMIKPQKVFFMAVDGVAPRAKMNQQRGRRFRSAKEAEKMESEARRKGETLPKEERFDSNCITPGTVFMARLHEQLRYFVVNKVSTDKLWQKCKIILSGQETPGEGEHKIMDYIRFLRSQPGYDPNTRHCLYGLDADLIMLGLCTHDPHFSLLREEVKFGKKVKRSSAPEEIRFYLLHLSLMREYLELEFAPLKDLLKLSDKMDFNIEKIIDDWILMGFLVGNDFIPNLPNLHIANGALPVLYEAYMEVLPTLDGYINEAGTLNLERFEKLMSKLAELDLKNFEESQDNLLYMKSKIGQSYLNHNAVHSQKYKDNDLFECLQPEIHRDPALDKLIQAANDLAISSEEESDLSNEEEAFKTFKNEYYRSKMDFQNVTPLIMREQAEGYVRAIQWNLNYYYNGVCSWSWFYPHHYAPYVSDIKAFSDLKIEFELGTPFKPYEQLLAVLPTASKNLLPKPYHCLMTEDSSIIKEYYPEEFQTDLNGKRQEWEAVVLVPFIDEKLLLDAMKPCNELLSPEEVRRNSHGPMLVYTYVEQSSGIYQSPEYFPVVMYNHASCTIVSIEDIRVPKEKLIKGTYPGALFDVFYPGFPTMKHLKYTSKLEDAKIKVFEMSSRNKSIILKILSNELTSKLSIPEDLLGKIVWVGWPHLVEARVVAVSSKQFKYTLNENSSEEKTENSKFESQLDGVVQHYRSRMGIDFGKTEVLVHVNLKNGQKYIFSSNSKVVLEKRFSSVVSYFPLQTTIMDIKVHNEHRSIFNDVSDVFPMGSVCFSLTNPYYGSQGIILDSTESLKNGQLTVSLRVLEEPNFETLYNVKKRYHTLAVAASQVTLSNYVFSRITGSLYVYISNGEKSVNIGLNLKFNKKNMETPEYTIKIDNTWYYTDKAVVLVRNYVDRFPGVFDYLSHSNEDNITAEAIFQNDSDEELKAVQSWLKSLPSHNAERRICGSSVLEGDVIAGIEKIVDDTKESARTMTMQIKPQHLFKSEIQTGNLAPDESVETKVFDRIVNVRDGITVPLGLKGTVIAVHRASSTSLSNSGEIYDVVFDKVFTGGMALNCTKHRGYRLQKNAYINLSYGKRRMEQKTGIPGALRALAREKQNANNFYSNSNRNANINVRQQSSAFASFNQVPAARIHPAANSQFSSTIQQVNAASLDLNNVNKNSFHYLTNFSVGYQSMINKENSLHQQNANVNKEAVRAPRGPPNFTQSSHGHVASNTDILKKVLKIESRPNGNATRKPNENPLVNSRQGHSGASYKKNVTSNAASATARLLSYYQSNALGCPRYTYLEDADGVSAQVVLPNSQIIYGKTAKSREDASENVAVDALNIIENLPTNSPPRHRLPSDFPVPPTKWVQERPQQIFVNKSHQNKQSGARSKSNSTDYTSKSPGRSYNDSQQNWRNEACVNAANFVPLQALKNHRPVKGGNNINNGGRNVKQEKTDLSNPMLQENISKEANSRKEISNKPARYRKTRIAANFRQ